MKRKKKKKHEGDEKETPPKLNRLDIISKIDDLSSAAQRYKREGNLKEAIKIVNKITDLAIRGNMPSYIKEQDEFLKEMAKEVKKDHMISKIIEYGESISNLYGKLVNADKMKEAHELVEDYRSKYEEYPYFNTLPIVRDLLMKDRKEWIKQQSGDIEAKVEEKETSMKDELSSLLKELEK
ncbi:MAG: hypothetical protein R6U96_14185 [Promethearchaeia archaeon]